MKKKTILLTLAAALLLGSIASAAEPSKSYMDSLIRAGQPVPTADNRRDIAPPPKAVAPQTAPAQMETPANPAPTPAAPKKDAPALRYRGHGPAAMPRHHGAPPADIRPEPRGVFHGVGPARPPKHRPVRPAPRREPAQIALVIDVGPDHSPHHPQPQHHPRHGRHGHR